MQSDFYKKFKDKRIAEDLPLFSVSWLALVSDRTPDTIVKYYIKWAVKGYHTITTLYKTKLMSIRQVGMWLYRIPLVGKPLDCVEPFPTNVDYVSLCYAHLSSFDDKVKEYFDNF